MITTGVRGLPMTDCSTKVQNMAYMNVIIGSCTTNALLHFYEKGIILLKKEIII